MPRVEKMNLSDHTLDINVRRCNYDKFDFSELEDFVLELTGDRDYQFKAIKEIMIYLWGGSYKNLKELASENYKEKPGIQQRFQSEENFLGKLPLPNRLSGVVHMATGTGKTYVMFAIAYLSIVLGKVKRVLVLGPPSTVIESGSRGKFREHLYGPTSQRLQKTLPDKYRNIPVNLLDENNPIEDNSIVIENINAIWYRDRNSLGDTLFSQTDEILVLSDEVHHAYSHLKYIGDRLDIEEQGKKSEKEERLWMKFLREEPKIKRHIGFTGTPYNQDEYFADVIYNYSIKDAINDKVIKKINPIIKTEAEGEEADLTLYQKFEQILQTHFENKEKYSYTDSRGNVRLKPITIFINNRQTSAKRNTEEFTKVSSDYLKNTNSNYAHMPASQLYQIASDKVLCVISKPTDPDYQEKLDAVEEIDKNKTGGKVEFIFAVDKLSEGWDVDNVYQIVPMEERIFASKRLISQVLGRGLRLPRTVPFAHIQNRYPIVTITNHEKFAQHIEELLFAVTDCETRFISKILNPDTELDRAKHNFHLFNLEYIPAQKTVDVKGKDRQPPKKELILTVPKETLDLNVTFMLDQKRFELSREFYTIDQIVHEIAGRFERRQFENRHFDFGDGISTDSLPDRKIIEKVIKNAMEKAGFKNNRLSDHNKKQIEIYFNQYLPRGSRKVVRTNVEGNLIGVKTENMASCSIRSGELDRFASIFISEHYDEEIEKENKFVLDQLVEQYKKMDTNQIQLDFIASEESEYFRNLVPTRPIYLVNKSMFKTPQSLVIVSHKPERDFIFSLINNAKYITSWLKSIDKGFYSLDYEYFKRGKDRTLKSFNPDFFIKFDLEKYIDKIQSEKPNVDVGKLRDLQNRGVKTLIRVVEIKSDEDKAEVTRAKERYGKEHIERLNNKLQHINPIDVPEEFSDSTKSYYTFDLLTPHEYGSWFYKVRNGSFNI
jgi:type III restriction enzyme